MRIKGLMICALFALCPRVTWAADPAEDLIVMLQVAKAGGTSAGFGAGIVVAQSPARTVIVTANHVIRTDDGDFRGDVSVEFNVLRGKLFKAATNAFYTDRNADLAVIFIDQAVDVGVPLVLTPEISRVISPTAPADLIGSNARLVGFMKRRLWASGMKTDKIIASESGALRVKSADAAVGASGGAVLDSFGRLIGMTTRIDPTEDGPGVNALPMSEIQRRLARWRIDTGLQIAAAPTATHELDALARRSLKINVQFLADRNLADRKNSGGKSSDFPHRVSALLPEGLLELAPTIDLGFGTGVESAGNPAPAELKSPDYALEIAAPPVKIDAQITLHFADGRQLGPMTQILDFEAGPKLASRAAGSTLESEIKYALIARQVKQSNARARQTGLDRSRATYEKSKQQDLEAGRPLRLQRLKAAYPLWSMHCRYRDVDDRFGWDCGPQWNQRERRRDEDCIHEIRLGSEADALLVSVSVDALESPYFLMRQEVIRLLTEGADKVYISMRLTDGTQLETRRLCKVERNRAGQARYCN